MKNICTKVLEPRTDIGLFKEFAFLNPDLKFVNASASVVQEAILIIT